jgi:ATP-dependent protease ClpP protease subunit
MLQVDLKERVIYLDGYIGPEADGGVDGSTMRTALARLGAGPIRLDINSPGGCVFAARQCVDMLLDHRGKITTTSNALVASSGATIFLAGADRLLGKEAAVLVHSPWSVVAGDHRNLRRHAEILEEAERNLSRYYGERTGADARTLATWFNGEDHWITPEQSYELRISTSPTESRWRPPSVAASAVSRERWHKAEALALSARYGAAVSEAKALAEASLLQELDPSRKITQEAVKRSPSAAIKWLGEKIDARSQERYEKLQTILDAQYEVQRERVRRMRALGVDHPWPTRTIADPDKR